MSSHMTRREVLAGAAAGAASLAMTTTPAVAAGPPATQAAGPRRWSISLNTATLRGHKLPLAEVIDIAAKAGYQGIEPWTDEIDRHVASGGTLKDLRARIRDQGLAVTGFIAFFEWMVDDDARRAKGFDEAKRRMEQAHEIGGMYIAAPPAGDVKNVDLIRAAGRYRELLEIGAEMDVVPALEIWGFASNLFRLGQAVAVAIEAQHPKACVLPDIYHLHKGGSGFAGIRLLNPAILGGFHLNDYPATPPREAITDKDRVFPGDGVAPLVPVLRDLRAIGYRGPLSVELFNPAFATQDPLTVAKAALEKTSVVIRKAQTP